MQLVILCGGYGKRVRGVTEGKIPKSLIPIKGKPFIHYQLEYAASQRVTDVLLCIGYLGSQIKKYVGNGSKWGLKVKYINEGKVPKGSAYSLLLADDILEDRFILMYGDVLCDVTYRTLLFDIQQGGNTLVVFNSSTRSNVRAARCGISILYDKNPMTTEFNQTNAGVIAFNKADLFNTFMHIKTSTYNLYDLDILLSKLSINGLIKPYVVDKRACYEIGSYKGIKEFTQYINNVK